MKVIALSKKEHHHVSKTNYPSLRLLKGLGVEGDTHMGKYIKHRSRVRKDPTQPSLRQVHLIHVELFEELKAKGFNVLPGEMVKILPQKASTYCSFLKELS